MKNIFQAPTQTRHPFSEEEEENLRAGTRGGAQLHASHSSSGLAQRPASYTQQYFGQEKAIRAAGDEAGLCQ